MFQAPCRSDRDLTFLVVTCSEMDHGRMCIDEKRKQLSGAQRNDSCKLSRSCSASLLPTRALSAEALTSERSPLNRPPTGAAMLADTSCAKHEPTRPAFHSKPHTSVRSAEATTHEPWDSPTTPHSSTASAKRVGAFFRVRSTTRTRCKRFQDRSAPAEAGHYAIVRSTASARRSMSDRSL
jgi:hypothetical protein